MPNITMCINHKCPMAKKCYRHKAKPSDYQSVSLFKPSDNGKCDKFEEIYKRGK